MFSNVMFLFCWKIEVKTSKIAKNEKCLYKYFIIHIYFVIILYNYFKQKIQSPTIFLTITQRFLNIIIMFQMTYKIVFFKYLPKLTFKLFCRTKMCYIG